MSVRHTLHMVFAFLVGLAVDSVVEFVSSLLERLLFLLEVSMTEIVL